MISISKRHECWKHEESLENAPCSFDHLTLKKINVNPVVMSIYTALSGTSHSPCIVQRTSRHFLPQCCVSDALLYLKRLDPDNLIGVETFLRGRHAYEEGEAAHLTVSPAFVYFVVQRHSRQKSKNFFRPCRFTPPLLTCSRYRRNSLCRCITKEHEK